MNDQLTDPIEAARRSYAEELRFTAHIRSRAVFTAFAAVPRERFLGAGPWRVRSPMDMAEYWTTEDGDPRAVYHDVLIALDERRQINNGQPSLWAFVLDQLDVAVGEQALHLGCGTGYYTAVAAELVGQMGKITAIEIDPGLAEKARAALMPWPQITVSNADGANLSFDPVDLIIASAGATHPLSSWLDALKLGGRLPFPMTAIRHGGMLLVTREAEDSLRRAFSARSGSLTSAVRAIRTSTAGSRRRLLRIGGARCGRCAAIIMHRSRRVGCIAKAGVSRIVCPQSRGLRRHELRRPSASHDSPSRRGVSNAGDRRRVRREGRHAFPGILRAQHPQPGLSIDHLAQHFVPCVHQDAQSSDARSCNITRGNPEVSVRSRGTIVAGRSAGLARDLIETGLS
jgi:protein-L-isoaspartate(D-aspartate) O-methyltransferase